ncbi:elongation factor G [Geothermobacter hydrogeniphilus]|uniref:Elongation factor G n=1 Tax=Geothermobacter hydrogeniphilus TaxID=1969733 RepID=A0A1X0Y822_9BACT|nr:elongation factor G [Geothermobacter hydrogeniphilus]ORJ61277.1 elongation factor G [Geothermobacter hydrogeniphilus]
MSQPPLDQLRNFGIISHIDAGKTTVSERFLFYTGEIHKMGEVHDGSATMDWMEQEQQRGITITATATSCRWRDWWFNLIDTPGHIDFTIEVERSLRALDGALAIFSAVEGVQPQSESVWRQADRYRVPRICLINKMDRVGADFEAVLQQMREQLQARPVLLQWPIGSETEFNGIIDLLERRAFRFDNDRPTIAEPVPETLRAQVEQARERLVETAADFDEEILNAFLDGEEVSADQLRPALRRGTIAGRIFPVLLGSALRNKGIQPLLDAIGDYLPSPLDIPPATAHLLTDVEQQREVRCDPEQPLCALAFKVLSDEGRKLTYLRLYSGRLRPGDSIFNSRLQKEEKVARLFRMHAHKRERLTGARAGDIVAAAGLKESLTGDTLCAPEQPLVLSGLSIPEPVVSLAVEPKGVDDRDKLFPALEKLQWEDPTFRVHEDEETGQTILTGMGELHLEVVTRRLADDFGVAVITGRPQVVYRESIRRNVEHREIFQRETEGKIQAGDVLLALTPLARGEGVIIELPKEELLPAEWRSALEESLELACRAGARTGYPLTDLRVEAREVPIESGVTTETGLRAAAQRGLTMAARDAGILLLEPLMMLEITTPEEFAGKVLGSLQQKRGQVEGMTPQGGMELIRARVPLSEMFGYMTELRSATRGRGTFSMEFSHFDRAPDETQQRFGLA